MNFILGTFIFLRPIQSLLQRNVFSTERSALNIDTSSFWAAF